MKKCPFCAEDIQDAAIVCKHCGRDVAPATAESAAPATLVEPTKDSEGTGCFTLVMSALGVLAVSLILVSIKSRSSEPTMADTIGDGPGAAYICREFVRDRLKAPATAEFQSVADAEAERVEDSWRVRSYVDSQNGFGALIRSAFTCAVTYNKGTKKWHLDDLKIEKR